VRTVPKEQLDEALAWCRSALGPADMLSEHSREHGGHESAVHRLRAGSGICYLKVHQSREHWHNEVHAYERWARAFGQHAPELLAVRDREPLALVIGGLPGKTVDDVPLSPQQERAVWRAAGEALVAFHEVEQGQGFGPCLRDGAWAEAPQTDAVAYVANRFGSQVEHAVQAGYVNGEELSVLRAAQKLTGAFRGEKPVPCHRDYGPANWLVNADGSWVGVIDFEFCHWDVRVADFSRYPDWTWLNRPDLIDAFFAGYGHPPAAREEQQLLVAHAE
jgi:Ser/Thr protein kinase RdoA (MazF antagonist)